MQEEKPICIFLFSGKRKSGKDFLTELLVNRIGSDKAEIIRISAPIKSHWATTRGLELDKLLDSGSYKEQHRLDMIRWSEEVRAKDHGYFCRLAVQEVQVENSGKIWIVSDTRRKTDLLWFREQFGNIVKTIRVVASEDIRVERGWRFTTGVDDAASECDLDDISDWDWTISNNFSSKEKAETALQPLLLWVEQCTS